MRPIIVIPAYEPPDTFPALIDSLIAYGMNRIVVVDDGSPENYQLLFRDISQRDNVTVLHHAINFGKGQALKTAFNHVLLTAPIECPGVITVDADGQHAPNDVATLAAQLSTKRTEVILGVRTFGKKVPMRSRFGNILTRHIFRIIVGIKLTDTQTGLRAISLSIVPTLLCIPSRGFDYEFETLIYLTKHHVSIRQVPIQTLYLNKNRNSHFRPIIDSMRIYYILVRHLKTSFMSFLIH